MICLAELRNRIGIKPLLIGIALVLLVLNIGRLAAGYYQEKKEAVVGRMALLERYQASILQLPELRNRVESLEQQKMTFENFLVRGNSEEEIASAMQLLIQEQLVKAGLEPESLRPVRNGEGGGRAKDYGSISIKVRSSGRLDEFIALLASLYRSGTLFQVESFTISPQNQGELKIFIDFKGYYKLA
jgi:hypothetical protein